MREKWEMDLANGREVAVGVQWQHIADCVWKVYRFMSFKFVQDWKEGWLEGWYFLKFKEFADLNFLNLIFF
jgi:hypothetical protein